LLIATAVLVKPSIPLFKSHTIRKQYVHQQSTCCPIFNTRMLYVNQKCLQSKKWFPLNLEELQFPPAQWLIKTWRQLSTNNEQFRNLTISKTKIHDGIQFHFVFLILRMYTVLNFKTTQESGSYNLIQLYQ